MGFEILNVNVFIFVIFLDEMFLKYVIKFNMYCSYLFVFVICYLGCVIKFREGGIDVDFVVMYFGKNINFEKKKRFIYEF